MINRLKREITISRQMWKEAESKWEALRGTPFNLSKKLTLKQLGLYKQLLKNKKSLNGLHILYVRNSENRITNPLLKGMILKVINFLKYDTNTYLEVEIYPLQNNSGSSASPSILRVYLSQIEQVQDIFIAKKTDIYPIYTSMLKEQLSFNSNIKVVDTEKLINDTNIYISNHFKDIDLLKERQNRYKEELKNFKKKDIKLDDIFKNINYLKKIKKVHNAYLLMNLSLIVEINTLYKINNTESNPNAKEDKNTPIGRFIFELSTTSGLSYSKFYNIDYSYSNCYDHPNLDHNKVCAGNNFTELNNYIKTGAFYEAVDKLIFFFSLFPHDSGTPYVNYRNWLNGRSKRILRNKFKNEEKLWILYPERVSNNSIDYSALEGFAKSRNSFTPPPVDQLAYADYDMNTSVMDNINIDQINDLNDQLRRNREQRESLERAAEDRETEVEASQEREDNS